MKRTLSFLITLLFCRIAAAITLNGVDYTIDTLAQYPTGPGATYYQLRMLRASDRSGRLDCYLLAVDTRNPYVGVEQVLGKDQLIGTERLTQMAMRKSTPTHVYYAGVNGDFFVTQGDVGRPTGLTIVNDEFAYTPTANRRLGGVDEQLRAVIGTTMKYSGKLVLPDTSYTIQHVNYTRAADELVLYNQYNGATTATNMYGTELHIRLLPDCRWHTSGELRAEVLSKQVNIGSMAIPSGEAVLSGHGTMQQVLNTFAVGDTLTLKLSLKVDGATVNMSQCIGGDNYALIVNNGKVEQTNFWNELHPRTAFGCSEDKSILYFLVVDGRGVSAGCTTKVLGEIIRYYGAYTAVNWDGGGSSGLFIRPFGLVNNGSDGSERAVGNAMFAVANIPAEDNTIAAIAPYQPICLVPRYGVLAPKFLGYNRYGVLIDTCVQAVRLQCDASLGEILPDGRFLASGTESGTLTAVLDSPSGTVSCPITVRLSAAEPVAFRLDSLLTDNFHPYQVQIQSVINGKVMDLLPSALTWLSSDESVATVDADGIVRGVADGYADIIGKVGTFADTLRVHVINPVRHATCWDNFSNPDNWLLTATTDFNPTWEQTDIAFDYAGGRGAFVRMANPAAMMLRPDTVRIPVMTEAVVQKITMGIRPNNAVETMNITLFAEGLPVGQQTNIDIDVAATFGTDAALFPLHFDYLKFFLSSATAKTRQRFAMNGIWLLCDKYIDTNDDLPATRVHDASGVQKCLTADGVVIIRNNRKFSVMGVAIK